MHRQPGEKRFRIADLTVDLEEFTVLRQDGRKVELPRLSFDLLVALARRAPAVVSPEELIATVWAGVAVADETLTQRVALLRRALGDEARSPRYLRAVRGRGYQLIPAVQAEGDQEPDPQPGQERNREADQQRNQEPRQEDNWEPGHQPDRGQGTRRSGILAALSVAAGVLVVAGLLLVAAYRQHRDRQDQPAPRLAPPAATAGTTDPAAAVATRSPTGAELVRRADAYLGQHQEANNELAIELYQRALQLDPRNPRALAGLSMALSQRGTKFNQHAGDDQALALAQRALALDPRLGRAHHALGLARDSRGQVRAALAAYQRAASLEAQPAAALASAANLLQVQGHLAAALEADLRAARLGAGDPPVYLEVQVGGTLAALGFEPAATVWFERALELRPDNVFAAAAFAGARLSQGRVREADAIAAGAIARGIRRPELADVRGAVALLAGDMARAKVFFAQALAVAPHDLRARTRLLVLALQEAGARLPAGDQGTAGATLESRRRDLRDLAEALRRGRAEGDEWPDSGVDLALLETAAGNDGAALQALDAAIDLGYRDAGWLELEPMLVALRRDTRFGERLARMRRLVDRERQGVVGAPWLPPALLAGSAARM
jgi:DNA-binding winged helix-turn-helix (wHTH) protein/tetratricopeptide (TPR) repeat protein